MTEPVKQKTLAEQLRSEGYIVAPCKGCGAEVVWATNAAGNKIPLSPRIPVYTVIKVKGESHAIRTTLHIASHFVDCPKRELFRK